VLDLLVALLGLPVRLPLRAAAVGDALMNEHVRPPASPLGGTCRAALDFEAPWLIEKLVKDRIVATPAEGEALFTEVKRYLVMARSDESRIWEMYSLRVDEVWHAFILYTVQYTDFCHRHFGRYIHHAPSNAPRAATARTLPVATFAMFRDRYAKLFGCPLSDAWYDERSVGLDRHVRNERAGRLALRHDGDMVSLIGEDGEVVFAVSDIAAAALAFVAVTGAFYVRELPGDLDTEEKVALAEALVECRILKAAG
jgi:hypothetical protein